MRPSRYGWCTWRCCSHRRSSGASAPTCSTSACSCGGMKAVAVMSIRFPAVRENKKKWHEKHWDQSQRKKSWQKTKKKTEKHKRKWVKSRHLDCNTKWEWNRLGTFSISVLTSTYIFFCWNVTIDTRPLQSFYNWNVILNKSITGSIAPYSLHRKAWFSLPRCAWS